MKMDMNRFQDEHLDLLIRLAFQMEEAQAVQQLMDEAVPEMTAKEKTAAQSALEKAFVAANLHKKQERKTKRTKILRKTFTRLAVAMLCIVVLAALALPITFTASAEFREKMMQLFTEENKQRGEIYFGLTEHPEEMYQVPGDWPGEYFPTYIPEGLEVKHFDQEQMKVEYWNGDGARLCYWEKAGKAEIPGDQGPITLEMMGEHPAAVYEDEGAEGGPVVRIWWQQGEKTLFLEAVSLSREEALNIARSVKTTSSPHAVFYPLDVQETVIIIQKEAMPEGWTGARYLDRLPEGFTLFALDVLAPRAEYRNDAGGYLVITETREEPENMPDMMNPNTMFFAERGWPGSFTHGIAVDGVTEVSRVVLQTEKGWTIVDSSGVAWWEMDNLIGSLKPVDPDAAKAAIPKIPARNEETKEVLVPEGWTGNYFPTYLPDGFFLYEFDPLFWPIEYRNNQMDQVYFAEMDEYTGGHVGTDGATVTEVDVNGHTATVVDGIALDGETRAITILWSEGNKMLSVNTYDVSLEEALKVARSVQPVEKTE